MIQADIQWKDSPLEVSSQARRDGKLILIFLFDPECAGCQAMNDKVLSHPCVVEYIDRNFAPVRLDVRGDVSLFDRYDFFWTPTFVIQDTQARESRRIEGYLPPEMFVAELALGRMKEALDRHQFERAVQLAPEVRASLRGDKIREPEGYYWSGVAEYRATREVAPLKDWWNRLMDEFPESDWARRAEIIRGK